MVSWFKRVRKDDLVFGSMLYMGDKLQYWEGNTHFAPTGTDFEVFVDGTSDDNLSDQHQFFERVCENWSQWSGPDPRESTSTPSRPQRGYAGLHDEHPKSTIFG